MNFISCSLSRNTGLCSGTAHRHGANFEPAQKRQIIEEHYRRLQSGGNASQRVLAEWSQANFRLLHDSGMRPRKTQRVESGKEAGARTVSTTLHSRSARSYKKAELLVSW